MGIFFQSHTNSLLSDLNIKGKELYVKFSKAPDRKEDFGSVLQIVITILKCFMKELNLRITPSGETVEKDEFKIGSSRIPAFLGLAVLGEIKFSLVRSRIISSIYPTFRFPDPQSFLSDPSIIPFRTLNPTQFGQFLRQIDDVFEVLV